MTTYIEGGNLFQYIVDRVFHSITGEKKYNHARRGTERAGLGGNRKYNATLLSKI